MLFYACFFLNMKHKVFLCYWKNNFRYKNGTLEKDRAGTWIAGGYRFVLFALTGDLDYFHAILGCPNWSLKSGPCVYCKCTANGPMTWTDFREGAPWRAACWSKDEWHAWPGRSRCSLLTLPGASCWTIAYDWLHAKHLGCDQYMFGSVLSLLVNTMLPATPEQNLKTLWAFLKQYFKENRTKTPFRYLNKLTMFQRKNKFSKLRGKGSELRHFGNALNALWDKYKNPHLEVHRQISLMLRLNCKLEATLSDHKDKFSLPPAVADDFEYTCRSMMLLQNAVAEHFISEGEQYFDVTSKSHFVQHLAMLSKHISPRVIWAFKGEDQMARMQQLCQSCTKGNTQAAVTIKMARHYRIGLHLLFKGKD